MTRRLGIEVMTDIAKKRGGKCLSTVYKNIYTVLEWVCCDGHNFSITPSMVRRGMWCPYCQNKYYKERICRKIFEELFGVEFPKSHPKWLNHKELDGYNKELGLGFEYNGHQHYIISFYHNKQDNLENIKLRDKKKYILCVNNNVILILIPYYIGLNKIKEYIVQECEKYNIVIPFKNKRIDYKTFDIYSKTYYRRINTIAINCGGKCLSKNYLDAHTKMEFRCSRGHFFTNLPCNIIKNNAIKCSYCAGNNKKNILEMQKIALEKNGKCLSLNYDGAYKDLIWECNKGHRWFATPKRIYGLDNWCPFCNGGSNNISKHTMLNVGVSNGVS